MYMEYKEGPDFLKGILMVANGGKLWRYEPRGNQYFEAGSNLTREVAGGIREECFVESGGIDEINGIMVSTSGALARFQGSPSPGFPDARKCRTLPDVHRWILRKSLATEHREAQRQYLEPSVRPIDLSRSSIVK